MTLSLTLLQVIQTKWNPATHLTCLCMNLVVSKMADKQQQQQEEQQFCCSVCKDLPKEPVTINCGHNYCRSCIEGWWDQEKGGRPSGRGLFWGGTTCWLRSSVLTGEVFLPALTGTWLISVKVLFLAYSPSSTLSLHVGTAAEPKQGVRTWWTILFQSLQKAILLCQSVDKERVVDSASIFTKPTSAETQRLMPLPHLLQPVI